MRDLYELTLKVRFDVYARDGKEIPRDVAASDLALRVRGQLETFDDGRRPFSVEQLTAALQNVLLGAFESESDLHMLGIYKDEMVQTSPTSQTSRAYLEMRKETEGQRVILFGDVRAAGIGRLTTDEMAKIQDEEYDEWKNR